MALEAATSVTSESGSFMDTVDGGSLELAVQTCRLLRQLMSNDATSPLQNAMSLDVLLVNLSADHAFATFVLDQMDYE